MSPNSKQTDSFHVESSSNFGLSVYLSNLSKVLIDSGSWYSDTSLALVLVLSIEYVDKLFLLLPTTSVIRWYKCDYPQSMLFVIGSYYTCLKSLDVLHGSVFDFPKTWKWLAKPLLSFTTTATDHVEALNYNWLWSIPLLLVQLTSWDFCFSSLGAMFFEMCFSQAIQRKGDSFGWFQADFFKLLGDQLSNHKALGWKNFNEWRIGDVVSVQQFIIKTPCVFVQVFTIRRSLKYIYCIISLQELRWEVVWIQIRSMGSDWNR